MARSWRCWEESETRSLDRNHHKSAPTVTLLVFSLHPNRRSALDAAGDDDDVEKEQPLSSPVVEDLPSYTLLLFSLLFDLR